MAIGGDVTGFMKQLVQSASVFLFNNAVPMVGRIISSLPEAIKTGIKSAAPQMKAAGGKIIGSLKDGMAASSFHRISKRARKLLHGNSPQEHFTIHFVSVKFITILLFTTL